MDGVTTFTTVKPTGEKKKRRRSNTSSRGKRHLNIFKSRTHKSIPKVRKKESGWRPGLRWGREEKKSKKY